MKKTFCCFLLLLLILPSLSLAQSPGAMYIDGKDADRVHLRQAPDSSSPSLGLYFTGAPVYFLSEASSDWSFVRIGTETGYVFSRYLSRQKPSVSASPAVEVHNEGDYVNLRSAPLSSASILMQCPHTLTVTLLGETVSGWSYVNVNGHVGYISTQFLRPVKTNDSVLHMSAPQILGETADGLQICAFCADNGQTIYYTTLGPLERIEKADVNFDGYQDLVITVASGASNEYVDFYLFDGTSYRHATVQGEGFGIPNYHLIPEKMLVSSYGTNGYAGALHESILYRWEGDVLSPIRRAVSDLAVETLYGQDSFTEITYNEKLRLTITDYTQTEYEGEIIFDNVYTMNEIEALFAAEDKYMNPATK